MPRLPDDNRPTLAERWLLPLLLLNIPVSENGWRLFGVVLGQVLFWAIIVASARIASRSPYRTVAMLIFSLGIVLRVGEAVTSSTAVGLARHATFAVLFVIAGATAFGRFPRMLQRQLVIFFALSVPVMVLQITGAHPVFLTWDIDPAHDEAILSLAEIGTFKMLEVFPTLFVEYDDLYFTIAQGRPSGLFHANNVLSVLVVLGLGVNLGLAKTSRLRFSDLAICTCLVLTMSLTASASLALLLAVAFMFGPGWRRLHALKVLGLVAGLLWLYSIFFPGLFVVNLSESKLLGSLYTRGLQILDRFGISFLRDDFYSRGADTWGVVEEDSIYSGIEIILASPAALLIGMAAPLAMLWYYRKSRRLSGSQPDVAVAAAMTACAGVLTQFGVPYFGAPSFQCLFGFALFPMFPALWRRPAAVASTPERPPEPLAR
ncbi:MAG: hypothetical protein AMXMBFR57_34850 [Acidimicrobiia bacterium]